MEIIEHKIHRANITVVFDSVDCDFIRRNIIRTAFSDKGEVIITDFPEGVIVIFPGGDANYQGNRLAINTDDLHSNEIELLSKATIVMQTAIEESNVVAYGFNFEGDCLCTPKFNVNQYLIDKGYIDCNRIGNRIKAEIIRLSFRIGFYKYGAKFAILIDPAEEPNRFIFQCNIHFDSELPEQAELKDGLEKYSGYLIEIMEML